MFGDVLYNLFIMPIEMIIELIFSIAYKISSNPGLSIIAVSLVVNFLVLPLYKRADKIQDEERKKQAEMKPWLDHIKKTFKGDKRYMMTQVYYRQQNYKPIYALKSSISLLLQIPFFMAAYHFLSNLSILQDCSFWIFPNLGQPDQLIHIGSISINLLPILMTAINIISGAIYTKGFPMKDKIQLYAMALIFLVLLYTSPSGLVFYWTLNNVFSFFKTIIMKWIHSKDDQPKKEKKPGKIIDKKVFFFVTALLTLFTGLYIPLMIISASPQEFVGSDYGPIWLVVNTFSVMAGFFMVWLSIFYYLGKDKARNGFIYGAFVALGIGILNFFVFGNKYGNMSKLLTYDNGVDTVSFGMQMLNLAICLAIIPLLVFVVKKWPKIVKGACIVLSITCIGVSVFYISDIQSSTNTVKQDNSFVGEKIIPISKNDKNVVVIMLDRYVSNYLPKILEEKPELKESLAGFTFYPNTVSYGPCTNYSVPALFGGYDYTPLEMNKRDTELLKDKHNESLLVLPKLFTEKNYNITIFDPPYAGDYSYKPNFDIYKDFDNIKAYDTEGVYNDTLEIQDNGYTKMTLEHNFVYQSVFRCAPTVLKHYIYDSGKYLSTIKEDSRIYTPFIDWFATLYNMPNITDVTDNGDNLFLIQNSTTHQGTPLSVPDYMPKAGLSVEYSDYATYMADMAATMQLAKWFDYLKANDAYDNTKIIICSDHGWPLHDNPEWVFGEIDVESFNPLLMVKDFGSTEFKTDESFMTLADIPALASEGIFENPVNPFTKHPITMDEKKEGVVITSASLWDTEENNGTVFDTSNGAWYHVKDNIFKKENWTKVGE